MKFSGILALFTGALLLSLSPAALAQASVTQQSLRWDVFLGGSFARGANSVSYQNVYGWDAAASEYPYSGHPWIGGTVEASGHYYNRSTTLSAPGSIIPVSASAHMYTLMGGPSFAVRNRGVQPFARFMLGDVMDRTSATVSGATSDVSSSYFGMSLGGGIDVPISARCAIRGQADWIPYWAQSERQDVIRASAGIVFKL